MPLVDVVDDTFVRAAPGDVRATSRASWEPWLAAAATGGTGLDLVVGEERGAEGVRWRATARSRRWGRTLTWRGSAEVWLEPAWGGTVVHLYVRLDPDAGADPDAGPGTNTGTGTAPGTLPGGSSPHGRCDPDGREGRRRARHARLLRDVVRRSWKRGLVQAYGATPGAQR